MTTPTTILLRRKSTKMASLDSLTDSEIRLKLSELGCPVGPVTATTRKVLLKKLKLLLDQNKGNINYDPHCSITQFSSGEESDDASTKRRRRSMPPPKTTKSPRKKSPIRTAPLANSTFSEASVKKTFSIDDNTSAVPAVNIEGRRSTRHSLGGIPDFTSYRSPVKSSEFISSESNSDSVFSNQYIGIGGVDVTPTSTSRFSTNSLGFGSTDGFRSRLQPSGSNYNTQSSTSYKSNQPYSSEFARRLSSMSSRTIASPSVSSKLLDVKESDDEDNGSVPVYAKFNQSNVKGVHNIQNRGNGRGVFMQDNWFSYDSPVSAVLVVILLLFFLMIGATYINMHSVDTNIASLTDLKYPLCSLLQNYSRQEGVNCIPEERVQDITIIFKVLQQELYDRAVNGGCLDAMEPLSDKDITSLVVGKETSISVWTVESNLKNLKVLIKSNPEWKIVSNHDGIMLADPPITLFCYFYKRFIVIASWLFKAIVLVGGILTFYQGGKWWMRRNARYNDEVYKLVANILDIVSSKAQDSNSFVPISHVRDQLIPPKDRKRMGKLWNDAVAILESDSRLRFEVQQVEGEEFAVWRWLASPLNSKRKVWQGQAFETVEGSVNSLPDSPTPCLKIRHMFDPTLEEGDDWATTVQDAILEKCGEAKILHIVVDKQSREGCVYMKCASQHDAGVAFRALQGSWFDSKLVSVKYIREKRYLERFPESVGCTEPARPSNDNKNSLQN